jgi:hypothetical protein
MPNDLPDTLKGFTPDGSGLDRDALLFEAGRASAGSPARAWRFVALLALSQVLTLGFCLPRPPASLPLPAEPRPPSLSPGYPDGPMPLRALPEEEAPAPASELLPADPPMRPSDRTLFTAIE